MDERARRIAVIKMFRNKAWKDTEVRALAAHQGLLV